MKRDFPEFPFIDYKSHREDLKSLYREVQFMPRLMSDNELTALYEIAAGLHSDVECNSDVMEFGTFCGASAVAITTGLVLKGDGRRLYTFDHGRWYNETIGLAASVFKKLKLNRCISQITDDIDLFFERFKCFSTYLIFHDAATHDEALSRRLERFFPFIMDNGWFTIHDYNNANAENIVKPVHDFIDLGQYEISVFQTDSLICLQKRG